jgi:hypothetical protein
MKENIPAYSRMADDIQGYIKNRRLSEGVDAYLKNLE